jgi:hypothetical protein
MTLNEIVDDYIRVYRSAAKEEMREYEQEESPQAAIRRAALSESPDGKRHPHQRRISRKVLEQAEAELQSIGRKLSRAVDFAALHNLVNEAILPIRGIGALAIYDIAHRIGAYFRKAPERVYLHAGTKVGARALNISGESIDPTVLPPPFSRLRPAEIEDCLCLCKDELHAPRLPRGRRRSTCRIIRPCMPSLPPSRGKGCG